MKRTLRIKFTLFTVFLLAIFIFPTPALADDGIIYGEKIAAGTTVDHDVVLVGQNVSIEGTVNGNVFILGNQVLISGKVNGSLVMIAQNAAIGGEVSGAVYAVALTVDLPEKASLARDLYAATVSLTSKSASQIGRHLFALGLDAGLNGQIGGDLHTTIGPIQLYNGMMRLLGFEELTIELHFEMPAGNPGAMQSPVVRPRMRLKLQQPISTFDWSAWGMGLLRDWGVLFVLGLLGLWLLRKPLESSGGPLRSRPWRTLGIGLLVLVITLNLFLVALLVVAMIFALGLGLNAIGLWQVSLALWILAYSSMAIALTLLWLFIVYGTKILVSYHLASWLVDRFILQKALWLNILALFLGALLYALLRSIPYVGWAIGLLIIAAGMGSAWLALRNPSGPPQPLPQPLPVMPPKKAAKRSA
jgi:cytoskeletal protein CcmA (bactofilin family)